MPGQVASYTSNMNKPPRPSSTSSSSSSSQKYSTFLDVVLDHVCCAATASDQQQQQVGGRRHSGSSEWQQQQKQHSQHYLNQQSSSRRGSLPLSTKRNDNNKKKQKQRRRTSSGTIILPHLRFNPLIPTLSSSSTLPTQPSSSSIPSSISSLQDFFTLFLADDAPHSFQLFHEKNGDENVKVTTWKNVATAAESAVGGEPAAGGGVESAVESTQGGGAAAANNKNEKSTTTNTKMERTITFQTNITPGSSSNPLSQSEHHVNNTNNTNSNLSTTIPLGVTITQKLHKLHKKWMLDCEFSFEVLNHNPKLLSSGGSSSRTMVGLSQFLMSHVVKKGSSSIVNVCVILTENDLLPVETTRNGGPNLVGRGGGVGGNNSSHHGNGQRIHSNDNGSSSSRATTTNNNLRQYCGGANNIHCNNEHSATYDGAPEGLLSCLSHPLLLPPDGLCSARTNKNRGGAGHNNNSNSNNSVSKKSLFLEGQEPAHIGASLLSAIQAKNSHDADFAPDDDDGVGPISYSSDAASLAKTNRLLAKTSLGTSRFDGMSNNNNNKGRSKSSKAKQEQYQRQQQGTTTQATHQEDVLSLASSRGSLKIKHIPSFEVSRAPSTASMRRVFLENGNQYNVFGANHGAVHSSVGGAPSASTGGEKSPSSDNPPSPSQVGLSMHIEMDLGSSPNNNNNDNNNNNNMQNINPTPSTTSSLSSSSYLRTASFSNIDEKVRRGLKKRIARSWISWAESWCMRLWEEERSSASGRRLVDGAGNGNGRGGRGAKRNVRPTVRRIGEAAPPPPPPPKNVPKNVWKPLLVQTTPTSTTTTAERRSERWMSCEKEDEMGVEVVSCTMPVSPTASSSSSSSRGNAKLGGKPSKMKRRLLKTLSSAS